MNNSRNLLIFQINLNLLPCIPSRLYGCESCECFHIKYQAPANEYFIKTFDTFVDIRDNKKCKRYKKVRRGIFYKLLWNYYMVPKQVISKKQIIMILSGKRVKTLLFSLKLFKWDNLLAFQLTDLSRMMSRLNHSLTFHKCIHQRR